MKFHFKKSFAVVSIFLVTTSFAADVEPQKTEIHFGSPSFAQDSAYLQTIPVLSNSTARLTGSAVTVQAAAAGLSYLQISNVGSSSVGWESISANLANTTYDHGGVQLRVATIEIGYGNVPVARYNGSVLPSSTNYLTENICQSGSTYVIPCAVGQTIVGFRKYWNLDGKQNGSFSYQNTSTNSPWNTVSDSISIL